MMTTADSQTLCKELAQALQEFWEDYTGVRPAHSRVVLDEQSIAVCLEQILTPAEQEMASTRAGREKLKELKEHVLAQAKPCLQQLVEVALAQEGIMGIVLFDVTSGNVLGFFQLGQKV